MTTIVYRDGVLAGDTLVTDSNGFRVGEMTKVIKFKDGSLFGVAGTCSGCSQVMEALKLLIDDCPADDRGPITMARLVQGDMRQELQDMLVGADDMEGLVVLPLGGVYHVHKVGGEEGCCGFSPTRAEYHAIGSGRYPAMGAMLAGFDAKRAVYAAMAFDTHSGGEVVAVELTRADG